jgi:DNA-binding NtrC family response regulator
LVGFSSTPLENEITTLVIRDRTTLMETKPTHTEAKRGETGFEYPIVGKSKAVEGLIKQISSLAQTHRDVLIVGEAGVGKGAIAKNIYFRSTGGAGNEQANGGTVLIEELEEASFRNQMKILTFMNERQTRRIGGESKEEVQIRLLVTLKEDPQELVERRKLLPELLPMLTTFEKVEVPPLRQRPEDVPVLVKHFTAEICRELGVADLVVDINSIDVLVRQPWRENIRELKAVVDKCVLFSHEGRFMLPPELVDEKTEVIKMINNIMAGQEFVLDRSLDVIEKGIIERALEKFGFNQSKAAQFLGMTEQTFRYKLKRLGIASARARS